VEKLIFQEAASRCAFCGETSISTLEIHHIYPLETGGSDEPENLILLCASCHDKVEAGQIRHTAVIQAKARLAGRAGQAGPSSGSLNVIEFRGRNSGIVANVVQAAHVRVVGRTAPKLHPPPDVIAADGNMRSYAKHLIDRYLDWKRAEVGDAMKYQIIYAAIKREFGSKWDHVPRARFDALVLFLQRRIDQTIFGRNRRAQGYANYSTFEEYVASRREGRDAQLPPPVT
jgi:HNH endonuclease.